MAANSEIIGRSEKYPTAPARDHGLPVIMREAPEAQVQDLCYPPCLPQKARTSSQAIRAFCAAWQLVTVPVR
ncbi:YegP family protein [Hymenobacter swuensis]|uniref:DUF1508 domain-containing protein n=1 Tax=Hymenobacter swuensis DY53 TaxID=1227739 RepID=W8F0R7_9BACT|nr:YegP family protein [Hymenobacter swuensis]AHJ95420.1 hypothetical protein Hsw_PA0087 [Hymenobacter swuensis DY53]